ncbi:MAG: DUF6261 family protein [Tannerella sp.]|jgi:hypothetical protein|nr:DUF6261 family protein [Tannerella sp.]
MNIGKIYFGRLRNEAHYEFFVVFGNLLIKFPSVMALISMFYQRFLQLLERESWLVDSGKKSPLTEKLADADRRIDRDISSIRDIIRAALNHFDQSVAEAAKQLFIHLKKFGSIRDKPYEEESAAVQLLVRDLRTTFATQAQAVGIAPWVDELESAEAEFTTLFEQRNTEAADRPQDSMKDVRREMEDLYRKMTGSIQNDLNVNGDATCGEFTVQLNEEIKYFNEHTHHRTKRDIAEATVASIPDQDYTGQPITFIPEVWYEHRPLVFASDFTVTYRNNILPGNAELTLHGKGDFKGKKTVTFNIIGIA